jgi:periplasmic divalent cation tolerance protein
MLPPPSKGSLYGPTRCRHVCRLSRFALACERRYSLMSSENTVLFAYITTPHIEEARTLGRHLVDKQLAGCVNIIPAVESIYPWEGKIEQGPEVLLIAKTVPSLKEALTEEVLHQHSYDCPCILFFEADAGNLGYIEWLRENLAQPEV